MSATFDVDKSERIKRGHLNRARRFAIADRDGWICHYCGIEGDRHHGPDGNAWHIDHMHPVSLGGSDDESNLVLSCQDCNLEKHDTPYEEFVTRHRDLTSQIIRHLAPFRNLVVGRGGDGFHYVYFRTNNVDIDSWETAGYVTESGRATIVDLVRAASRLYHIAQLNSGRT